VLLPKMLAPVLLADKAYGAEERVLKPLKDAGKTAHIPSKSNQPTQRVYDTHLYKERRLIENFNAKLKQFRAIATRYDKRAISFLGAIYFISTIILLN
jgi:transposase